MRQTDIYLRHRESRDWYRIACDEDTKYYLFDDSPEPVGLTADSKEEWEPITKEEYEARPRPQPSGWASHYDSTIAYFNGRLLERAKSVVYSNGIK